MATRKHREFVTEPMEHKSVRCLPGIADVLGRRLERRGFGRASDVLGQYLLMGRNPVQFTQWMQNTSGANARQARLSAECLRDWCDNFI